ncbi:NAD(P)/FAD-dependent oxidoreductase [Sinimarinibacterium sp. NLF-5-8]|uniref:flavin-containing monooxygenase n=1 Tax=Sinimarinibacterium sp. NLF-5-8 TaxID=2698684 RepID=UPI00137C2FAA|nr:NAD(P)/FAD-dependent oxidoreductase [Sinimarinibacterium sp. NLF-5-8]QHS09469.1 NAD(P)/FAD-dependent oxidoreductase [Sinimarinibacterium sp. NLF-5-8]
MKTDFDALIIGAGLSGIGMACHLAMKCPQKHIGIIERRQRIGGTWDLFRYPGIRSDSDMFTFGFAFKPWTAIKTLADGPSIRAYLAEAAREYGVMDKIQYGLQMTEASWSGKNQCWTVKLWDQAAGEARALTCKVLLNTTGYYNHDQGYLPRFAGEERFKGIKIHPQHWPEDLDYAGKRVVIIGSGATAVTLVPSMAATAQHVTMLQRTPSYVISVPSIDRVAAKMQKYLPAKLAYKLTRQRNLLLTRGIYKAAQRWPDQVRKFLLDRVRRQLDSDEQMRHFTPDYKPWDQRLCAVPSGDLFKAIRKGTASVVTDQIDTFTETGIQLKSGQHLDADIIITATGLQVQVFGGAKLKVDGKLVKPNQRMTYKGVLMQDVPNLALVVGYTNAPWTLKADLAGEYVCRLFNHMDQHGYAVFMPHAPEGVVVMDQNIMGTSLNSGYVQRADGVLPRQGKRAPWRVEHHYESDRKVLLQDPIADAELRFEAPAVNVVRRKAA